MKKKLNKDESIYQISVTEIAFILCFLLVLLLGYRLTDSLKKVDEQQNTIDHLDQIISLYLGPSVLDPQASDDLMPCNKCISHVKEIPLEKAEKYTFIGENVVKALTREPLSENKLDELYQEILTATRAISSGKKVRFADKKDRNEKYLTLGRTLYDVMEQNKLDENSMLILLQKLHELTDNLAKGREIIYADEDISEKIQDMRNEIAALNVKEERLKSENVDLIKTNKYLTKRAGLDLPPCWLSDEGKAQYMFNVKVSSDAGTIIFNSIWPEERKENALSMEPVQKMMPYENKSMPLNEFIRRAQEIRAIDDKNPQGACRHYIRYDGTSVSNARSARKTRVRINECFYMYEVR